MIYIALSVVCSVLVSVHLKLSRRFRIDVGQAVAWNYVLAALAAWLSLHPSVDALWRAGPAWWPLVGLGVLLPAIFVALGASVRHAGIVRSDAAQRLSLVLSLLAAFALFGQHLTRSAGVGMALGLLALLALIWRKDSASRSRQPKAWVYPLVVFGGFGCIDILLKRVSATGLPLGVSLLAMFVMAFVVAMGLAIARRLAHQTPFSWRNLAAGLLLGLLNFGNILFYLRAHQSMPHDPALVFASVNLGVVALGAIVGAWAFGERLYRINVAGLLLALLAIGLLTLG